MLHLLLLVLGQACVVHPDHWIGQPFELLQQPTWQRQLSDWLRQQLGLVVVQFFGLRHWQHLEQTWHWQNLEQTWHWQHLEPQG